MNSISTFVWSYFALAGGAFVALAVILVVWAWQYLTPARSERPRPAARPRLSQHRGLALHH